VEFREDKSMVLCKPVRSHQERARAKKLAANAEGTVVSKEEASNSGAAGGANDVVELLDSDSD
jgi:hypothetical protein